MKRSFINSELGMRNSELFLSFSYRNKDLLTDKTVEMSSFAVI